MHVFVCTCVYVWIGICVCVCVCKSMWICTMPIFTMTVCSYAPRTESEALDLLSQMNKLKAGEEPTLRVMMSLEATAAVA